MTDHLLCGAPPFARPALIAFLTLAAGCRPEPTGGEVPPPLAPAARPSDPLAELVAELDALEAQAERLAAAGPLAVAAGVGCRETCALYGGARSARFEIAGVDCHCVRPPNLGVHRGSVARKGGRP